MKSICPLAFQLTGLCAVSYALPIHPGSPVVIIAPNAPLPEFLIEEGNPMIADYQEIAPSR